MLQECNWLLCLISEDRRSSAMFWASNQFTVSESNMPYENLVASKPWNWAPFRVFLRVANIEQTNSWILLFLNDSHGMTTPGLKSPPWRDQPCRKVLIEFIVVPEGPASIESTSWDAWGTALELDLISAKLGMWWSMAYVAAWWSDEQDPGAPSAGRLGIAPCDWQRIKSALAWSALAVVATAWCKESSCHWVESTRETSSDTTFTRESMRLSIVRSLRAGDWSVTGISNSSGISAKSSSRSVTTVANGRFHLRLPLGGAWRVPHREQNVYFVYAVARWKKYEKFWNSKKNLT
jgi:hypothetical protein